MKFIVFRKIFDSIKYFLPVYDFGPVIQDSDNRRDKNELILDIQRKRKLTRILGQKVRVYFMMACTFALLLTISMTYRYFVESENGVTKRYMEQFGMRLENINTCNADYLIENSELLVALSFLKDNEYEKGAILLSSIETEEAKWLEALCYVKIGDDVAAKASLSKIVSSKGDFSVSAQQILERYYD